jgi:DNA-binding NtrC family response regulator
VDDEPTVRAFLRAILQRQGFNCLEADNAVQATRIIAKLDGRLDLLITDCRMPGEMDGVGLAHSIRGRYPKLPIIMVSGYPQEEGMHESALEVEFVQKPFVSETILKAVRKVVDSGRQPDLPADS